MTTDRDILCAYLDRVADLAHLALITPPEDRARMECTIQFVCQALQTVAWVHQRTGNAEHQREAAEVAALCQRIVEQARAAGLRIMHDDSYR
jgi:hypothetical protein